MIKSFKDKETEKVYNQIRSSRLPNEIQQRALIKLMLIDNAEKEIDFMVPPSNHYEHLKGDRKGESSIRINDKWRITFKFTNGNAFDVKIEDYH